MLLSGVCHAGLTVQPAGSNNEKPPSALWYTCTLPTFKGGMGWNVGVSVGFGVAVGTGVVGALVGTVCAEGGDEAPS